MRQMLCHYSLEKGVALVRMDDGKVNALSRAMFTELLAAIERAEEGANAIVLTGRPGILSAGFDLREMTSAPDAAVAQIRAGVDAYMRLYESPLPVVAACPGHALAGGSVLLLAADYRVGASGDFRIGLTEVEIGIPLPVFAVELARARLATAELERATLRAHIYGPDDAVHAGYLDEVLSPEDVLRRAREEALKLAEMPRVSYAATKTRLRGRTIEHIRATVEADLSNIARGQ